ncbi:uncharacterized protein [Nicotiana sylvestris]|uniref:uncharacterized protein n=1 Tax=Nicotiana sylvestris TaxID=4096 RepID=UPI00388C6892
MDELCESRLMIQGFNQGGQRAIGAIKLEINMGDLHSSAWMHVIDAKTSYNILLGRPWIHENKVEVKVDDVILTKSVAKKVDATTSKENITVEKDQVLHDRNKMNEASSSKKVTPVLRYVPKSRKVEYPSFELQGKVLGDLTLPIKRIDAIKSSTKLLKGFVKSSSHNSLLNLALPAKRTDEGFDPNAYKLLAKAGYDPNESSKLGKLPPEASNPTQKMMIEKGYSLKQSREGLGYKQPPPIRISIKRASCNYIAAKEVSTTLNKKPSVFDRLTKQRTSVFDRLGPLKKENKRHGNGDPQEDEDAKDTPPELEEGVKTTIDAIKEVNLGVVEDPNPTYISVSLANDEEGKYIELLKEFKDQAQRRFRPELVPLIETEVNKLIEAGFVREVKYPTWISSILLLMIDATTRYEAMSFMDSSSEYYQIRMAPKDEELTAFRTPKGIYCYKVTPFVLKNAGATYQRAMQNIFDDMLHKNVGCCVDDLVAKSRKKDDHLRDLRMVFERL